MKTERTVPVYLLSGFLGSGKTTLLKRWLKTVEAGGRKPAVIMNELGEVNLDGVQLGPDVAMAEMLNGCICCTVRGDLGAELMKLVDEHEPDVVLIESTGAANPLDIIEAVGDVSLLKRAALNGVVAVVDAKHLLAQRDKGAGRTFRLMKEQIRCATVLILNKTDLVSAPEADELESLIREWNGYAPVYRTVEAAIDIDLLERRDNGGAPSGATTNRDEADHRISEGGDGVSSNEQHQHHNQHHHHHNQHHQDHHHHAHEHVMAYTHYFDHPVNSELFENMMSTLPDDIYRAKGILTFSDTSSRFMFQYAYKQLDLMRITPQGDVPDVAVFIGEHFDRTGLTSRIRQLAAGQTEGDSVADATQ